MCQHKLLRDNSQCPLQPVGRTKHWEGGGEEGGGCTMSQDSLRCLCISIALSVRVSSECDSSCQGSVLYV